MGCHREPVQSGSGGAGDQVDCVPRKAPVSGRAATLAPLGEYKAAQAANGWDMFRASPAVGDPVVKAQQPWSEAFDRKAGLRQRGGSFAHR